MSERVFIGLGTNLGDRQENLARARELLSEKLSLTAVSRIYETEPWGYADQPKFLNQVIAGETELTPTRLLDFLKRIEKKIGREQTFRYGPRVIDLDILFYGDRVVKTKRLEIPHPRIAQRAFVLVPLAELAPGLVHPVTGKSVEEVKKNTDIQDVYDYKIN